MANVVTLDDVVIEQMQTNERLDDIENRFAEFFTELRADRLDMLEALRELRAPPPPARGGKEDKASSGELGFLGTLSLSVDHDGWWGSVHFHSCL